MVEGIFTSFNEEHPQNVPSSIEATGGISTCVSDEHTAKAYSPIDFTDKGIEILFNLIHPLKAYFSIEVTSPVNETSVNDKQLLKVNDLITVTEGGMLICFSEEHPSKA